MKLTWREVLDGYHTDKEKICNNLSEFITDVSSVGYKYGVFRDGKIYTYRLDPKGIVIEPTDLTLEDIQG